MKIAIAQINPVSGEIERNIEIHRIWIDRAVLQSAELIIFPELSITGYEPTLANDLSLYSDDLRLEVFQNISDASGIIVGIGAPIKQRQGITIGLVLFHPTGPRQIYSKKYIHSDEEPYFIAGENTATLLNNHPSIALSICYELSIPQHSQDAADHGATIYLSSVAKTAQGILRADAALTEIAKKYAMTVLMSNCVGLCDRVITTGNSSVWNVEGKLLERLDETSEGLLVFDTTTQEIIKILK